MSKLEFAERLWLHLAAGVAVGHFADYVWSLLAKL